jgi:hypothetical protein
LTDRGHNNAKAAGAAAVPVYLSLSGETVRGNKQRKKYVLRGSKGFLREMTGDDWRVAELDSGGDYGQMA